MVGRDPLPRDAPTRRAFLLGGLMAVPVVGGTAEAIGRQRSPAI